MSKHLFGALFLLCCFLTHQIVAQTSNISEVSKLFSNQEVLPIKISYSNRAIKKETNDTTYINANFNYQNQNGHWDTINIQLRGRGNFRRQNCYFPPLRIKIKNRDSKGTLFEGNKRLKMVLPCFVKSGNNNKIAKEYMAYKFYEQLSPYHFKTRLLDINFTDLKGKRQKNHRLMGFLIEDHKVVAKRHKGNVMKRKVHPMAQDALCSVRNAFFQYMIGNTDYSVMYGHNEKLFFIDKSILPVPYDFDMSGLVNASYAVVSQINNESMQISDVRQRLYRGFKRPTDVFEKVRREFLGKKEAIYAIIEDCKPMFDNDREYNTAKAYIESFYEILINDNKFSKYIVEAAREK